MLNKADRFFLWLRIICNYTLKSEYLMKSIQNVDAAKPANIICLLGNLIQVTAYFMRQKCYGSAFVLCEIKCALDVIYLFAIWY